jgi:hypothetical protein
MVEEIEAWRGWTTSHASRDDGEALPVDMTLVHGISSSKWWTGDGKKPGRVNFQGEEDPPIPCTESRSHAPHDAFRHRSPAQPALNATTT